MVIDAHTHISADAPHPIGTLSNLYAEMDRHGIDRVVAFPLSDARDANERLLEVVAGDARVVPVAFIDPHEPDAARHLAQLIEGEGMRGLKIHPTLSNFHIDDSALLDPLFAYCDERRLNIVIHCTTDDPRVHPYRIESMARRFPHATFQIAHMGAIWAANAAIAAAKRCPNIYLDTAIASVNAVRRAINEVPNQVLMGADFPFYTYAVETAKVRDAWRFSDRADDLSVLARVMGETCAALYGLAGEGAA